MHWMRSLERLNLDECISLSSRVQRRNSATCAWLKRLDSRGGLSTLVCPAFQEDWFAGRRRDPNRIRWDPRRMRWIW